MLAVFRFRLNVRFYSIKHATKNPIKYTNTINLPKTKFPSRLTAAKREEVERALLKSSFASAYRFQAEQKTEPTFVLHDGPPYANGDLHVGHAVNKILKDITLRQHVAKGQKVNYVPGWDCHGLPIELKAMQAAEVGLSVKGADSQHALDIRRKSRQFALDAIERQKAEFISWGILGDWQDFSNIYLTTNADFIVNQLQMFLNFYEKGLVYRDLKPVYWSPSSRTALAEAELEYDANFVSPTVYVRFALQQMPLLVENRNLQLYALVWTTTPWTLPSNQAICYNANLEYALVKLLIDNAAWCNCELYMIATNLIKDFENVTNIKCEIVETIPGSQLHACTYQHPIHSAQKDLPFYDASHVQDSKGTGLVHTAPAHGPEDFLVSLQHKMAVKSFVNEEGFYTAQAPEFLRGKSVLEEGDNLVLQHMLSDIVYASKFTHAYPIDWRTKKPVIIRASKQWFINTDQLKERAVQEINNIEIYPRLSSEASKKSLITQVCKRPYWCISRQRVWGVPIPVFYEKATGKVVTNAKIMQHISDMIRKEGNIDFWWSKSVSDILPEHILSEISLTAHDLEKGSDIFDIWFDSGSTWSQVLKGDKVADVYMEGYDQFTGWFQSSLLTSVAARNIAPYKSIFVHGFTVDEKGYKMSKSLGNIIAPKDIIKKYGVDTLRWWVASHATQNMSITVSDKLLQQAAESIGKIRATLRYLNGVVDGQTTLNLHKDRQTYLNKYLLSALVDFENEQQNHYNLYEYNRVIANIQNFVTNQISANYVHLVKDRLYCGDSIDLENIRFTLTKCYEILCKVLWPITPFLVEESWSYYANEAAAGTDFHQHNLQADAAWKHELVENVVNKALEVKRLVNQKVNATNTWTLAVRIACGDETSLKLLQALQSELNKPVTNSELCEILQVSSVTLTLNATTAPKQDFVIDVEILDVMLCARCRRFAVENADCTCLRCTEVLQMKS